MWYSSFPPLNMAELQCSYTVYLPLQVPDYSVYSGGRAFKILKPPFKKGGIPDKTIVCAYFLVGIISSVLVCLHSEMI